MEFETVISTLRETSFLSSFSITVYRFSLGVFFSILLSGCFVWLSIKVPSVGKVIKWVVAIVQPVPKVILFPILLITLGMNDFARILLVIMGLFFTNYTILYNSVAKLLEDSSIRIINFYKVSNAKIIYFYYFKGLKEALLSILKNSIGYGLTLIIIAESSFCNNGIGFLIWTYWERYELYPLAITIIFTSLLALLLNYLSEIFIDRI